MLDVLGFPNELVNLTMEHFSDEDLIRFLQVAEYKNRAGLILRERFKAGLQREKELLLQNELIDDAKKEALRAIDPADTAGLDAAIEALNMDLVTSRDFQDFRRICRNLNELGLTRLPREIDLSETSYLNLSNNHLTSMPACDDFKNLCDINFSFNPIIIFPSCVAQLACMTISEDQFPLLPTNLQELIQENKTLNEFAGKGIYEGKHSISLNRYLHLNSFEIQYKKYIIKNLLSQIESLDLPTVIRLKDAFENPAMKTYNFSELTLAERTILENFSVSPAKSNDLMDKMTTFFGLKHLNYLTLCLNSDERKFSLLHSSFSEELKHCIAKKQQAESAAALAAPVYTPMKRAAEETEARAHASNSDDDNGDERKVKRLRST